MNKLQGNKEVRIIEYEEKYQQAIIDFLVKITTEEFNHPERYDYFACKLVEQYKIGKNGFWIALDSQNRVVGTCGALQQTLNIVKMNCFYITYEYRGTGLGERLYNLFMQFVEKMQYKKIRLCTYKEFDRAIRFYEKRGFKLIEVTEDEYWYEKEL